MSKSPVRYSQRKAWPVNAARIGRRWRSFAWIIAVGLACIAVLLVYPVLPLRELFIGLVLGAFAMMIVLAASGFDDPVMRGDMAEAWTRESLDKLDWPVVNSLVFDRRDLDHVVVAPCGLLAVETKYRYRQRDQHTTTVQRRRDLDATRSAAKKLEMLLRSTACRHDAQVIPVLVIWGPGSPDLPEGYKVADDVHVVDGDHPRLWEHLFKAPLLTPGTRTAITADLRLFQAKQVAHIRASGEPTVTRRGLWRECWSEFRVGVRQAEGERRRRAATRRALRRRHGSSTAPTRNPRERSILDGP